MYTKENCQITTKTVEHTPYYLPLSHVRICCKMSRSYMIVFSLVIRPPKFMCACLCVSVKAENSTTQKKEKKRINWRELRSIFASDLYISPIYAPVFVFFGEYFFFLCLHIGRMVVYFVGKVSAYTSGIHLDCFCNIISFWECVASFFLPRL